MKINYIWLIVIVIIIFMINKYMTNSGEVIVDNDKGDVNKETISPIKVNVAEK